MVRIELQEEEATTSEKWARDINRYFRGKGVMELNNLQLGTVFFNEPSITNAMEPKYLEARAGRQVTAAPLQCAARLLLAGCP